MYTGVVLVAFLLIKIQKGALIVNDKAREERNTYMREWRKKNRDRVREYNSSYWERKSKSKREEEQSI